MIERFHRFLHAGLSHYIYELERDSPIVRKCVSADAQYHNGVYTLFPATWKRNDAIGQGKYKGQGVIRIPEYQATKSQPKTTFNLAYKSVGIAYKRSHQINKKYYDRHAKPCTFETGEFVNVYNAARKPGLSRKFRAYMVTARISDLNYEILRKKEMKHVVHINRLKPAHGFHARETKPRPRYKNKLRRYSITKQSIEEQSSKKNGAFSLASEVPRQRNTSSNLSTHALVSSPIQPDTPDSEIFDPTYQPAETLSSRKEMQSIRTDTPVSRSRSKFVR